MRISFSKFSLLIRPNNARALFISLVHFIPFSFLSFIYSLINLPTLLYLCNSEYPNSSFKGAEIVFDKFKFKLLKWLNLGYSLDSDIKLKSFFLSSLKSLEII